MNARMRPLAALTIAAALLFGATGSALAANAGETILTSGLPLPAGAIPASTSGDYGDGAVPSPVSQSGRYVAFLSGADTLSPDADPDVINAFRKDRTTGEVVLVSRLNGASGAGIGANTIGADLDQAQFVDPHDAAATGADLNEVNDRHA